jgi:hypothetical protein
MNIKWTVEDKQFIRTNAHRMKDKEIASELEARSGRRVSVGAVRKLRQRMGIIKKGGRGVCELRN